ncbi:MAG TPA: hypothetical protein VE569_04980 [Acidimicrobiia bacterium]|jgi:MFS family permease|nr:hypothetical protein [Acidimicrobiia bacterium]
MTTTAGSWLRPVADADYRAPSTHKRRGIVLALVGFVIAAIAFFGNLAAAGLSDSARETTLAWTFGVTTTGFTVIKTGIAVVLWGILVKLWLRAESIKTSLATLVGIPGVDRVRTGELDTPFGKVEVTDKAPGDLGVHKMARTMFRPMLVMGVMGVLAGLIISFVWAGTVPNTAAAAWTQGLQFLGEAMLLSGISFLLGTILWAIRTAGGEVQEHLGVKVQTPKMPASAKTFVAIMMFGLIAAIVQFIGYLAVAGSNDPSVAFTWLGPLREFALGTILAAITLALASIANVLAFQFHRVQELIRSGERSS